MKGIKFNYEDYHILIDDVLLKKCTLHKELFPEENEWFPATSEYFYINTKNKTIGLHPECKQCTTKKMYKWRDIHPEYLENENKRTNEKYHNDEEYKQRIIENGIKQRESGYFLEWQQLNPEKCNEYAKLHDDHKITSKEWRVCKEYFNNECAYCGLPITEHYGVYRGITSLHDFHKDHVIHDGDNTLNNCIPSCKSCNCSKHTALLKIWYNTNNPNFTEERYNKIIQWITEDYKKYIIA